MPGRQQIPSFQIARGSTNERDTQTEVGSIFYNTDTSNVEVRHVDPSNNVGWRDLVMNNKEQIDISGNLGVSGKLVVHDSVTFPDGTVQSTSAPAPFNFTTTTATDTIVAGVWGSSGGDAVPNGVPIDKLECKITPTSASQKVIITVSILGEINELQAHAGIRLRRTIGDDATYMPPASGDNRVPMCGIFSLNYPGVNYSTTLESSTFFIVDEPNTTQEVTYVPLFIGQLARTLCLNRTVNDYNNGDERFCQSTISCQCV